MSTALAVVPNGNISRDEFGSQLQRQAETSMAAVQAREEATVKAEYVMAERHPRVWDSVRGEMLQHCSRPRFAEVSRYAKPVGKKLINGDWTDQYATGFTARFAETLAQEMGNLKPMSAVTFEDDLIRILRISVVDLQKNLVRHREVTFAKTVEKRGKKIRGKNGGPDTYEAPEGREVVSSRLNSYGEPTYLVKATDDEMRNKVNSEESKTQRDFILKFCPRDILEECEDRVNEVMEREDKTDPAAARKKMLDGFRRFGVTADDLLNYIGRPSDRWMPEDIKELRALGIAIKDGETTFQQALKLKFSRPADEDGEETPDQRQARIQRQMDDQLKAALERERAEAAAPSASFPWPTAEAMRSDFRAVKQVMDSTAFDRILAEHNASMGTLKLDQKSADIYKAMQDYLASASA